MPVISSSLAEAQRLLRGDQMEAALEILARETASAAAVGPEHALQLQILLARGERGEAEIAFDRAARLPARSADAVDALAYYARELGRHELSNMLYRRAVELAPDDAQLVYNLATSERSLGHSVEALNACERALELDPDSHPTLLLRSEIGRATREQEHVDELRARLVADPSDSSRIFIGYALGKELHDLGRYDEAFDAFAMAASTRRRLLSYDVADDERKLRRIQEAYPTRIADPEASPSDRHIFIIGLPRSGTTLIERILGALPGVRSNGETNNLSTALMSCAPATGVDVFDRCARAAPSALARAYEALAARDVDEPKIIEKLPLNYLYVGAILGAFPRAKIVWVRRDPVDSCFAMFRTLFGNGYPFSYSFDDLARYYAAYDGLMRHWDEIFSQRLIQLRYEDLVKDPAVVGSDIARACGLSWSEHALDLTRNRSASLTASASQVRGAIYPSSAGLWKNYGPHLRPLIAKLDELMPANRPS